MSMEFRIFYRHQNCSFPSIIENCYREAICDLFPKFLILCCLKTETQFSVLPRSCDYLSNRLVIIFFQRFRSNIAAHAVCAGDSRDFITSRHNLIRKGSGPQSWRGNHESLPAERKVGFLTELPPCSLIYAAASDDCEKVREVRRGSYDKASQGRRN